MRRECRVTEPGILSSAYSQFHDYSIGNVLLAWLQCHARQIPLGPIATFPRWKELGRHVRRGEKAIVLCQPVTIKRNAEGGSNPVADGPEVLIRFIYRPAWFVLAQTDGSDLPPAEVPDWDRGLALERLDIRTIDFASIDGNTMGYARRREIAINPVNPRPYKTLFHEVAHILLGHTIEGEGMLAR